MLSFVARSDTVPHPAARPAKETPKSVTPTPSARFRDIWELAWPQTLMMVFNFMIGFVDVWSAGRISSDVQASLGMITQLTFFFLVVAMAVANGSVAAISQSMGAGLGRRVTRYTVLVLALGVVCGALILFGGQAVSGELLALLQVPEQLRDLTAYFLQVNLYILPLYYLLLIANAVFRAQKRVFVPMAAMVLTMVVNTFGDLGFGLGWFGLPTLGYKALAWSTFASVAAGALFNLAALRVVRLMRQAGRLPWRWIRCALPYLWKVAWPGGLMQIIWQSAYMVLFAITASLPAGSVAALAGMTAGLRVESALFLPGMAFNLTAGILVGQSLGAGRFDLAKSYGYRILALGVAIMSLLALLVWWGVTPVTAFIAPDPAVRDQAVSYLGYNLLAIPFTLTSMIMAGALNGAGATLYNLVAFGLSSWLIRLPLAWLLGHVVLGRAAGIWLAMLVSQMVQSSLALYMFHRCDWGRFALVKRRNNGVNGRAAI